MLAFYERSIGNPIPPVEHYYSITDPVIFRHLSCDIEFIFDDFMPVLNIKDFPNESGHFMLWELSVSNDEQSKRLLPIFINDDNILRPLAGKKIWDAILDEESILSVTGKENLSKEQYEKLSGASCDYAYDAFLTLKNETEKKREEIHRKYMYAFNLRIEAAERIGIENIKRHKLKQLDTEKTATEKEYLRSNTIFPEFRPVLIVRMDSGNALYQ